MFVPPKTTEEQILKLRETHGIDERRVFYSSVLPEGKAYILDPTLLFP